MVLYPFDNLSDTEIVITRKANQLLNHPKLCSEQVRDGKCKNCITYVLTLQNTFFCGWCCGHHCRKLKRRLQNTILFLNNANIDNIRCIKLDKLLVIRAIQATLLQYHFQIISEEIIDDIYDDYYTNITSNQTSYNKVISAVNMYIDENQNNRFNTTIGLQLEHPFPLISFDSNSVVIVQAVEERRDHNNYILESLTNTHTENQTSFSLHGGHDISLPFNEEFGNNMCNICLQSDSNKKGGYLSCKHYFHNECIQWWLYENTTCPLCRVAVNIEQYVTPESKNNVAPTPAVETNTIQTHLRQVNDKIHQLIENIIPSKDNFDLVNVLRQTHQSFSRRLHS